MDEIICKMTIIKKIIKTIYVMASEDIVEFHGFRLDRFQIEAIRSIESNHSVVVSAATGTGRH